MITSSHMRLLEDELEGLRDRLSSGGVSVADVCALQRLVARMLEDGRGGEFEPTLIEISDLLETVSQTAAGRT